MTRGAVAVAIVFVACGGSAPPPETPTEPPTEDDAPAVADGAGDDSKAESEESTGASGASEASGDDLEKVLQVVIEDDELAQYLKLGEPGRFPLRLSGDGLSGLSLTKGSKPVEIVSGPKDEKDPVLVVTAIEITGKTATVRYEYDVEGIRGTAHVEKGQYGWELKSSRVVER